MCCFFHKTMCSNETLVHPVPQKLTVSDNTCLRFIWGDVNSNRRTCLGWSTAFWGSVFTLLFGWLVTFVTGCLKMEAVCLTGSDVFKSGLPLKISNTEKGGWGENGRENLKERYVLYNKHWLFNYTRGEWLNWSSAWNQVKQEITYYISPT